MQTALWYLPLAIGGVILSLAGGKVLHMISGYVLMMISGVAFIACVLLFALIPSVSEDQDPAFAAKEFWAYIFPAMCCGTLGMDIMFNVTNVFFTTALPKRDQATAGGVVNSLMCLGIAFWLGVTDVAISTAKQSQDTPMKLLKQYRISFWTAVALSVLAFCLIVTVRTGSAVAEITADEKEELDKDAQDAIEEMKASGQE
jgi:MFS family permease